MHRGVRDFDPALDESARVLLEDPANPRFIDADGFERLVQRVVRNALRLRRRASRERLAEILPLVELNDVQPLAATNEQVVRIGLSPAELDDLVIEQFADATDEVELPFLQGPLGREAESVDGQIIDVEEDALRSPETVFEFEE